MAKSALSDLRFHNEQAAFDYVEGQLWPKGPVCPHCQATGDKIGRLSGKTTRPGLRKCYACRKPFTVRIGSIFEDSHLPLRLWLQAIHLLCSSKKGISTRQLQRTLGCGMKTAWHLGHRIRFAMTPDASSGPLGGAGKTVEADEETALTNSCKTKRPAGQRKRPHAIVLSLVERGGNIRSVTLDHRGVGRHLRKMVHKDSRLVTNKAAYYVHPPVASHESADHSKFEWARGDVHVNTLEGFFSVVNLAGRRNYRPVHQYGAECRMGAASLGQLWMERLADHPFLFSGFPWIVACGWQFTFKSQRKLHDRHPKRAGPHTDRLRRAHSAYLCVPKIRFCNIDGEGDQGRVVR